MYVTCQNSSTHRHGVVPSALVISLQQRRPSIAQPTGQNASFVRGAYMYPAMHDDVRHKRLLEVRCYTDCRYKSAWQTTQNSGIITSL